MPEWFMDPEVIYQDPKVLAALATGVEWKIDIAIFDRKEEVFLAWKARREYDYTYKWRKYRRWMHIKKKLFDMPKPLPKVNTYHSPPPALSNEEIRFFWSWFEEEVTRKRTSWKELYNWRRENKLL